jgi:NADPH:quinone reductase-like Zn-dependent oxidoreductase
MGFLTTANSVVRLPSYTAIIHDRKGHHVSRILQFDEIAGKRKIDFAEVEPELPGAGEVRYLVNAFALNRSDLLFLEDKHYSLPKLPSRIGTEACGVVDAVGEGVTQFAVGDRVTSIPFHNDQGTDRNVAGEYAITPVQFLMPWPDGMAADQACSVTMQYLTAYFPLKEIAQVGPGDSILVTAASSSAGLAAIELGRLLGADVIAQTRTGEKAPALVAAGANLVLASDHDDLVAGILEHTNGRGVRVAYDPIGGEFLDRYAAALSDHAKIFFYGLLSGERVSFELITPLRKQAVIYPHSLYNHVRNADELARGVEFLSRNLREGLLRPIVDTVFPFTGALDAYEYLQTNKHIGKIVVQVSTQ